MISICDYAHWKPYETDYFNGRKQAYNKEKQRIADIMIDRAERMLIPGLKDMFEEIEIGTPLTNICYTGNPEGAIYGFDRSQPNMGSQTPVHGLYLASAWSHGGGFTPVMRAGMEAARHVFNQINRRMS